MTKLLDVQKVRKLTGLGRSTIYKLCRAKDITYVRIANRILFKPEDIEDFILQNRIEASK